MAIWILILFLASIEPKNMVMNAAWWAVDTLPTDNFISKDNWTEKKTYFWMETIVFIFLNSLFGFSGHCAAKFAIEMTIEEP